MLRVTLSNDLPIPSNYTHTPSGSMFDGAISWNIPDCQNLFMNNTALVGDFRVDFDLAKDLSDMEAVQQCNASCTSSSNITWCIGWDIIRVTRTSGRKVPACRLFSSISNCVLDYNQLCGVVQPLSSWAVQLLATNGTAYNYTLANMDLNYHQENESSVSWTWQTSSSSNPSSLPSVVFHGGMSLSNDALEWSLADVQSDIFIVRQVNFGFSFVAVQEKNARYFYSQHSKSWCAPGTGCQEWKTKWINGGISHTHVDQVMTKIHPTLPQWNPPYLPWAFKSLLGRSNWVGAWQSTAAVSLWSSASTLPFRSQVRSHEFLLQPAGIDTHLRCGNVLPYRLRVGIFSDLTGDGIINDNDIVVWHRRQYRNADIALRTSMLWKLDVDITSYKTHATSPRINFNKTLDYIRQMALVGDNMSQIVWLVGWQGTGHDTLYPSLNVPNPRLGDANDLQKLSIEAKTRFNTIVSYHINTDEAYWNLTLPGHDGEHNPESDPDIIARAPGGTLWKWSDGKSLTDPLQGPAYHISKTKDFASGQRWKRYKEMLTSIPVSINVHMDAWRDINDSFEDDEQGFIAENEEMACGCRNDAVFFWEQHGISISCEGQNGMASNPVNIVDFYWHANRDWRHWGKLIDGSYMGIDNDVEPGHLPDFNHWADIIYRKVRLYHLYLTDEMLNPPPNARYASGGNSTHWPYGGDLIPIISRFGGYFLPAVISPNFSELHDRTQLATLDPHKVYVYQSISKAVQKWILPLSWQNRTINSMTITPSGPVAGPPVIIKDRLLQLSMVPYRPVILTVK